MHLESRIGCLNISDLVNTMKYEFEYPRTKVRSEDMVCESSDSRTCEVMFETAYTGGLGV